MNAKPKLPFVTINVASTVDGKLAPESRRFEPFTSARDRNLMLELRAQADAVMCGARTIDASPVTLGPGGAKYRQERLRNGLAEYNLRVVVSGSATVNPEAEVFQKRFSPILVLTTARASAARLKCLQQVADEIKVCGTDQIDFAAALAWLAEKWKVRRLLCEGGGEINAALFNQGLVDEIYLTLAPVVFCGRNAPTMADGHGVLNVAQGTRLRLKSCQQAGSELFLVYQVHKAGRVPKAKTRSLPQRLNSSHAKESGV